MTKTKRVFNVLMGLFMLFTAAVLVTVPTESIPFVLGLIGLGMTLNGIRSLVYYFSMARHMVGGKRLLYRGIIFLDIGILTSSLADAPELSLIIYVAAVSAFTGLVAVLRAREEKKGGSPRWKGKMLYGAVYVLGAAAVLVCGFVMKMPEMAVYVYAAGLIFSAAARIIRAFRRTAIVYIQ